MFALLETVPIETQLGGHNPLMLQQSCLIFSMKLFSFHSRARSCKPFDITRSCSLERSNENTLIVSDVRPDSVSYRYDM